MTTRAQSKKVTSSEVPASKPCGCGSPASEHKSCTLCCLEQPRFYCGQLLGEDDLTALLSWSRQKFRLRRYHYGWGAVQGLRVHNDPEDPAGIVLEPGYAVDCCGEDIIVCDQYRCSLMDACPGDGCLDIAEYRRSKAETGKSGDATQSGLLSGLLDGAQAVDLYIRYREELADPRPSFILHRATQEPSCDYARTRESYCVEWHESGGDAEKKLDDAGDVDLDELIDWYDNETSLAEPSKDRVAYLQEWLTKRPLYKFSIVASWVRDARLDNRLDNQALERILFFLVLDRRVGARSSDCTDCTEEHGVPLARVWVGRSGPSGGEHCRVLYIDNNPPFRRYIAPFDCDIAGSECINLLDLIWASYDDAAQQLTSAGNTPTKSLLDLTSSGWGAALSTLRAYGRTTVCRESVDVLVVDAGQPWGERVVGFGDPSPTS
jgi:hypothetical protein